PAGFILTIDAYRQFYESNDLGPKAAAEIARIDPDDPVALERSAGLLRALIVDGIMPNGLRAAIEGAYERLVKDETLCRRVAVRSSATAEDTAQFSFAGMFESYLNVSGKATLIETV